jgi:hypothetical protein
MVTWQVVALPEHPPPDHPVNVDPEAGLSLNVTTAPEAKPAEQVAPQSIPDGLLVTVPDPVPDFVTVRVCDAPPLVAKVP